MVRLCAVMLVKDELDIIEATVRHLLDEVERVYVADNMSSDGTREILEMLARQTGRIVLVEDRQVGYYQAEKTTRLAQQARLDGYEWVIPCDADEWWYCPTLPIVSLLEEQPDEVLFVRAALFNHITSGEDDWRETNPVRRIGWRFREKVSLGKVACRLSPELRIGMGNHAARSVGSVHSDWPHTLPDTLVIRHFPWRTEQQHLSKLRNGARAYALAPGLDEQYGEHWRQFGLPDDENFACAVNNWFWEWGHVAVPNSRPDLIYDPVLS